MTSSGHNRSLPGVGSRDGIVNCYPFLPHTHLGSLEKMSGKGEVSFYAGLNETKLLKEEITFGIITYGFGTVT